MAILMESRSASAGAPRSVDLEKRLAEVEHRLADAESLLEIGVRLGATLDLSAMLELALETAEEVCRVETSSIWEVDDERGELFFRVVRGRAAGELRGLRVRRGEGIVGSVAQHGQPEVVNDISADPRWKGDPPGFVTRAILAVPLLASGSVIGVLQLLNPLGRPGFDAGDVRRMQTFAALLAAPMQNARLYDEQRRSFTNTVTALALTVEKKDPYTRGHVDRVVSYSMLLGTELGLDRRECADLWLAAALHDIGKIAVPDRILGKPAPLDSDEVEVMKRHTVDGAHIVTNLANPHVLAGVRGHHERIDGKGYPDGLKGDEVPLTPRIIAVADTFDAITTSRPYRKGLTAEQAATEILAGAGTQFCPRVVAAFERLFASGRFRLESAKGGFSGSATAILPSFFSDKLGADPRLTPWPGLPMSGRAEREGDPEPFGPKGIDDPASRERMGPVMLRLRYAIEGEDRFFPLVAAGRVVHLGRGGDNDIVLSDVSVSRNHAEIRGGLDGWSIHDLKSTNGIEINRVPVEAAPLHPGDRISIGAFELVVEALEPAPRPAPPPASGPFAAGGEAAASPGPPASPGAPAAALAPLPLARAGPATDGDEGFLNATIIRPLKDFEAAIRLGAAAPVPAVAETRDPVNANRLLAFLTRLARVLLVAESVDQVLMRVLDIAFEALPVDRGFILLSDDQGELQCEVARIRDKVEMRPLEVPVSRTMLEKVMTERVALVTFDAQADQRLSGGESIRIHQIRSAMCAPLWSGDEIIGVIQVDSPFQVGAFGEAELDFLTTLANFTAVAVERQRYAAKAEFERKVRSRLERYHSPSLIEQVIHQGRGSEPLTGSRVADVSVLFADLVGFTAFAENAPPEHVADLLNGFLNLSVEAIFRAGGTLDKFIGDCVMAFFGAPMPLADHAVRAVRAAAEIQRELTAWSQTRAARGLPAFAARVGVNSGPVVVGDIGSNRRVDYTVLGNTVNVAARLESGVSRPGDVVIGPETHRLLAGAIPTEPLGEFQLKGLQQKVLAHRVVLAG